MQRKRLTVWKDEIRERALAKLRENGMKMKAPETLAPETPLTTSGGHAVAGDSSSNTDVSIAVRDIPATNDVVASGASDVTNDAAVIANTVGASTRT